MPADGGEGGGGGAACCGCTCKDEGGDENMRAAFYKT